MGRITATVLFTDLVGSTELRGRLGEEAADELRRRHDQVLAGAVEANNGRVVKGLGDGIMATFAGASDALAAAVAVQQAVDRLNRSGKAGVPLEVRVGLSAGDVSFEDDDVHGTPVIEASRLCGAARGGEILASEIVRWLGGAQGALLTSGVFNSFKAVYQADTGHHSDARGILEGLVPELAGRPRDAAYLTNLARAACACGEVHHDCLAETLIRLLAPYRNLVVTIGPTFFGAVAHHLGALAGVLARWEEAEAAFTTAQTIHERMSVSTWAARTQLRWAGMLLTRRAPSDAERARDLLKQALTTTREVGLANIERRAIALLGECS